jgi:hypothetical protein
MMFEGHERRHGHTKGLIHGFALEGSSQKPVAGGAKPGTGFWLPATVLNNPWLNSL